MSDYDVLVIGGGAAGLTAAMVLSRALRSVLVVDAGSPRNSPAAHLQGFLSRDGTAPGVLLDLGRQEVRRYGGVVIDSTVARVVRLEESGFGVELEGGVSTTARRLLVATGLRDELPDVPGLRERWARDVLHCPYCHGHEVRGQKLGVLGGSPGSVRYAQLVRQWSDDVVLFTPDKTLTEQERDELVARAIGIVEGDVAQVRVENDRLDGLELEDGRLVRRDALFVPPRFVPNNGIFRELGCEIDPHGWVVTDPTGQTTVPGAWAAGNVANPRAQVITAAGEGSAAAIAMNADLVDEDIRNAVREHSHGSRC
jgi:thioredoxin reductase